MMNPQLTALTARTDQEVFADSHAVRVYFEFRSILGHDVDHAILRKERPTGASPAGLRTGARISALSGRWADPWAELDPVPGYRPYTLWHHGAPYDSDHHQRGRFRCVCARRDVRRSAATRELRARRHHGDRIGGAHALVGAAISGTGAEGHEVREDPSSPSRDSSAHRASRARPRFRTSAASVRASRDRRRGFRGCVRPRRHRDAPCSSTSRNPTASVTSATTGLLNTVSWSCQCGANGAVAVTCCCMRARFRVRAH